MRAAGATIVSQLPPPQGRGLVADWHSCPRSPL
jgi:hypothetical protein